MPEAAEKNRIMEMVRDELKKDPGIENKELYEKAKEIDSSVEDLTLRQFHARYPLQIKRQMAQDGGRSKSRKKQKKKKETTTSAKSGSGASSGGRSGSVDRDHIRGTLLQLARDVASAEGKAEIIDLLAGLDDYVDEVAEALNRG